MNPGLLLIVTASLMLAGVGIAMWLRAAAAERRSQVALRLRVVGAVSPAPDAAARTVNPLVRRVTHLLWRLGWTDANPDQVGRGLLVAALALPLLMLLIGVTGGLLLVLVLLVLGSVAVSVRAARRRARILEQLPDYLESVMRILASGHTLEQALVEAARDAPEPLRQVFLSVGRQVRLGAALDEVLAEAAEAHGLRDLGVMALAASVNRRYGGSLRQIFRSLVAAVRARQTAQRELRALTAETRFSAVVLAVIPVALTAYIWLQNPDYYAQMWALPTGRAILVASVLLQLSGIVVIWRMMRSTEDFA